MSSRARRINVAQNASKAALAAAVSLTVATRDRAKELVGAQGAAEVLKGHQRAKAYRGQLRKKAKAATNALVKMGHGQIVLGHIHPRWLREAAAQALAAGEQVDENWLNLRKAWGKCGGQP